jgi:hypothetical protein
MQITEEEKKCLTMLHFLCKKMRRAADAVGTGKKSSSKQKQLYCFVIKKMRATKSKNL